MRSAPLLLIVVGVTGLALGLSALLRQPTSASTSRPPDRSGVPQGHVYTGLTDEPADVNPYTAHTQTACRFVLGLTHEGLLDVDPDSEGPLAKLRPSLASLWQEAPDGMSCTFTLRDGVQFSDGTPMTMADVLFGWELATAGHLELGYVGLAFARVRTAEALDDKHLLVTFREREYAAVRVVGEAWLVGKRQFFVDRIATLATRQNQPVPDVGSSEFAVLLRQIQYECGPGTGPHMLPSDADGPTTWNRRQDLLLVRNPHCWRRAAMPGTWNLDGMRLLFRNGPARFNSLVNREIDWYGDEAIDPLLEKHPELKKDYRKLDYDYPPLGVYGVIWNCRKKPLDDPRVRRALAMLVNQPAILTRFHNVGALAMALAKPDSPEYPTGMPALGHDPKKARDLLRDAGVGVELGAPLHLDLLASYGPSALGSSLDMLVSDAEEIGVQITVRTLDPTSWLAAKANKDWDGLVVNRGFRAWGDPYDFVHSKGPDNEGAFAHQDVDRLAKAARQQFDPVARAALLREMHEIVYREQPMAFFIHQKAAILFNSHIHEAKPGQRGLWLERFWVEPEFQRRQ